jgi:hypothetical protein
MSVFMSPEPLLDTWRGAAALAAGSSAAIAAGSSAGGSSLQPGSNGSAGGVGGFGDPFGVGSGAMTRQQYEEAGVDYLREFRGFRYPEL